MSLAVVIGVIFTVFAVLDGAAMIYCALTERLIIGWIMLGNFALLGTVILLGVPW